MLAAAVSFWGGQVHSPFEVSVQYEQEFLHSACCGGTANCALPTWDPDNTISINATLCGMIAAMDDVVGDLVAALTLTEQLNHTVIIWSSVRPRTTHLLYRWLLLAVIECRGAGCLTARGGTGGQEDSTSTQITLLRGLEKCSIY